ncbi:aconitate hydratase AcnA [Arcobacter sp. s6]|uniref:aconitate hydratase AcnA n=1 Tax=Arcobacter sp. s6 TaxID=3230363 RepID=UPI0034A057D4
MNRFTNSFIFNKNVYYYCDLKRIFDKYPLLRKLPNATKILLESNIRNAKEEDISAIISTFIHRNFLNKIDFYPNRVILEDSVGIPILIELALMKEFVYSQGKNPKDLNPKIMLDLVINNSLHSSNENINKQKYSFIKWASNEFENLSVIPCSLGVCKKVNLEYLSTMISSKIEDDKIYLYPETLVGSDSQTTMLNALGVLSYNIHEIEIQSLLLGSSTNLLFPKVIGIEVIGSPNKAVGINDILLNLINILREHKISDTIVEFYGSGLKYISIEDRATITSLTPKYGAICSYFAIDNTTIAYMEKTRGVSVSLVEEYYTKQGMFNNNDLIYDEYITLDLSSIKTTVAGPRKIEDSLSIEELVSKFTTFKKGHYVNDNDIVLAIISSTTSASLIQAGLLAKKACELKLSINNNIKRILFADSLIIKEYLIKLDLYKYFEELGFEIVTKDLAFYSTKELDMLKISMDIDKFDLNVVSIVSSMENFKEKIHPKINSNWLMTPALVIAYCLVGRIDINILENNIYKDIELSDIWPSNDEVNEYLKNIDYKVYKKAYENIFYGNEYYRELRYQNLPIYKWDKEDTNIQVEKNKKLFENKNLDKIEIIDAKILALLGNAITTEQITPTGKILPYTKTAEYLESKELKADEFGKYENRRLNVEIMLRGTFSNSKLKNKIVSPKEGGFTKNFSNGEIVSIYDFSEEMQKQNTPLIIFAGSYYGIGESIDWAAKGTKLLGVKAVIAKSFAHNHRLNLISMGILPLEFIDDDIETLHLKGDEQISIKSSEIKINARINIEIKRNDEVKIITVKSKLETKTELIYYKNGGVLSYLLKNI